MCVRVVCRLCACCVQAVCSLCAGFVYVICRLNAGCVLAGYRLNAGCIQADDGRLVSAQALWGVCEEGWKWAGGLNSADTTASQAH